MEHKKIMISQPMNGLTDEEITETRNRFLQFAEKEGLVVVNTLFTDDWYKKEAMAERGVVQIPLCFLAKAIDSMSQCHKAYFAKGWENARGCKIEHEIAVQYGVEIIYEEPPANANRPFTFGEKAVGLNLNPSGDPAVIKAQQTCADAIDQMNDLRNRQRT